MKVWRHGSWRNEYSFQQHTKFRRRVKERQEEKQKGRGVRGAPDMASTLAFKWRSSGNVDLAILILSYFVVGCKFFSCLLLSQISCVQIFLAMLGEITFLILLLKVVCISFLYLLWATSSPPCAALLYFSSQSHLALFSFILRAMFRRRCAY